MPRILPPKERGENCGQRPLRARLAKAERASGRKRRVLKSDMVAIGERGVRSETLEWSSRCKIAVQGTSKPGIMLHSLWVTRRRTN